MRAAPMLLFAASLVVALMGVAANGPDFSIDTPPARAEPGCMDGPLGGDDALAARTARSDGFPECRAVLPD